MFAANTASMYENGRGTRQDETEQTRSSHIQSLLVAGRVLEFLAETGRPQRVTDIAKAFGMTKARISRHLSTLAAIGLVAKTPDSSGYRFGAGLFRLANAAAEQFEITNVAQRHMVSLRNRISEALLLAVPAGGDGIVVSTLGSGRALSPKLSRGIRVTIPVSPTAWVILAFSPEHVRERVIARRSERVPTSQNALRHDVIRARCESVREKFYDFHMDPYNAGFSVLATPIFNHTERLEGALSIVAGKRQSLDPSEIRFLSGLKRTAVEISRALGSVSMANHLERTI